MKHSVITVFLLLGVQTFAQPKGILAERSKQPAIDCPPQCYCSKTLTRCISLQLKHVPRHIPTDTVVLDLRFNQLTHLKPGAFDGLKHVTTLLLNNNHITRVEPGFLRGLSSLKSLYLQRNQIQELADGSLGGASELERLLLHRNEIQKLDRNIFVDSLRLRELYLQENQIESVSTVHLNAWRSLQKLRLDGNKLICDCKLAELNEFLLHRPYLTVGSHAAKCSLPENLRDSTLGHLSSTQFLCEVPAITDEPDNSILRFGQSSAILNCKAEGEPKPEIQWLHNNSLIDTNPETRSRYPPGKYHIFRNHSLQISQLNRNDEGSYQCVATNNRGEDRSRRVFLEYEKPFEESSGRGRRATDVEIVIPPRDTIVDIRDPIYLTCRTKPGVPVRIKWAKDGRRLLSGQNLTIQANGDLNIRRASQEDAGRYTCTAVGSTQNNIRPDTREASANVFVRHRPIFTLRPADQSVREGERVRFQCDASAHPEPRFQWIRNSVPISYTRRITEVHTRYSSVLTIYPVMRQDTGNYTCRATNQIGTVHTVVRLRIRQSTSPKITYAPENVRAPEGHTVTFRCEAEGVPDPEIIWQVNGSPIPVVRGHFEVINENTLRVNRVTRADRGHYTCLASNTVGAVSADAVLHITRTTIDESEPPLQTRPPPVRAQTPEGSSSNSDRVNTELIRQSVEQARINVNRAINRTRTDLLDDRKKTPSELLALFRFPQRHAVELATAREIYEEALSLIQEHVQKGIRLEMSKSGEVDEETEHKHDDDFNYGSYLSVSHLQTLMELSGCTPGQFLIESCNDICFHSQYRSYTGQCNNLNKHMQGASLTPLLRMLPPIYENGFNTPVGWDPHKKYHGFKKPNAREVSLRVVSTNEVTPDQKYSAMLMQWGQFLDHDIDLTVPATSRFIFASGAICNQTCDNISPCFNIFLPINDPRRNRATVRCMEFERSSAVCGTGETSVIFKRVAPREQINAITSYIDGSQIYGNSELDALDLRDLFSDHGLMRFDIVSHSQKPYLPFNRVSNVDCQRNPNREHPFRCFHTGDPRANEQLGLLSMHTLWLREHNRIGGKFLEINPHWDGEKIYQESRKIVGATIQHITYEHWLPKILGPMGMKFMGEYKGYNSSVDASASNEFATAAFRFGHSLVNPVLFRLNSTFHTVPQGHLPLHEAFFSPERLLTEGGIDPIIRGLFASPVKMHRADQLVNSELTEKLFSQAHEMAPDLAALNIQRGRDHALPGYLEYRKRCGLSAPETWQELTDISNVNVLEKLKEMYGHPGNLDLWVGGLVEDVLEGGKLGPTFACIIADQFQRLRDGDRFWYENPGVLNSLQLDEIRKSSLGRVVCDNGDDIQHVSPDIFLFLGSSLHNYDKCETVPMVNLNLWQECCGSTCSLGSNSKNSEGEYFEYDNVNQQEGDSFLEDQEGKRRRKRSLNDYFTPSSPNAKEEDEEEIMEERLAGVEDLIQELKAEVMELRRRVKKFESRESSLLDSCRVNGVIRPSGDKWSVDLCTTCYCKESQIWCSNESCPPALCKKPIKLPFQCCQTCSL